MQRILSRAAQVRSPCHCPRCLPIVQGVARRVGNSGSVLRPQQHRSISTILSADIWVASKSSTPHGKGQRRQQWGLAIDGVKQEPEQGDHREIQEADSDVATQSTLNVQDPERVDTQPTDGGTDSAAFTPIDIAEDLDADLERNLDSSAHRAYQPQWPANTGPGLNVFHLPPQSIYARSTAKRNAEKMRWSEKKLLRVELSMDMLQLRFFRWLHQSRLIVGIATSSLPESYIDLILRHPIDVSRRSFEQKQADFDRLLSTQKDESGQFTFERSTGDVPLCNYTEDDLGDFREAQRALQRTLESVFSEEYQAELEPQLVCKVFYSLSASSAPPSVDIYNTLINGLRKRGHLSLANAAISSFFSSKLRPNEVSLAVILGFYTETDNAHRFRHIIQLMRGQNGGLMQSAPWNWRFKASNGRIIPHPDKPGQLIQLPHPTPMVLDAVVKGVLHFSGFDAALGMCRSLSDDGWGMDMRGFGILLNDCARRGDWDSGFAIWNQIVALKQRSSKLVDGRSRTETIMTPLFADMLRLCRRCNQKQAFADVWAQAKRTHPRTINRIIQMVRVERVERTDHRSADLSAVEASLESSGSRRPASDPATENSAAAREEALEALAKLRSTRIEDIGEASLQQEYLALKADVDFLKAVEGNPSVELPKTRSWTELARSAYSLIASHPTTLEKRTVARSKTQNSHTSDEERAMTYTELAKNAYRLVADHPSTLDRRRGTTAETVDVDDTSAFDHASTHCGSESLVDSVESQRSTPVTYASLAKNAYRLIADPSSTLERRVDSPKIQPQSDADANFMSDVCGNDNVSNTSGQTDYKPIAESRQPVIKEAESDGQGRSHTAHKVRRVET